MSGAKIRLIKRNAGQCQPAALAALPAILNHNVLSDMESD